MNGAGNLILAGTNNYTGGTTVSSGTLRVNGTLAGSTDVQGGTAAGTGTYGDVSLDGGTFTAGSATTTGTFAATSLTVNSGAVQFKFSGATADQVNLTGASNLSNSQITVGQLSAVTAGSYRVLTAGSPLSNIMPGLLTTIRRTSYSIDGPALTSQPNQIQIDVAGSPAALKWTGADNAHNPAEWDNSQSDANWQRTDGGTSDPTHFYDADSVIFDGTNAGPSNITISSTVTPSSISVTAGTYSFSSFGNIAGSGPLTVSGTGSLTINVNNSNFSGPVTVSGGTLTASSFASLGAGPVTLSGGTLNLGNPSAMGSAQWTISGGTIDNTSGGAMMLGGNQPIALNGSFAFSGAADGSHDLNLGTGAVTLGAANSTITVNAGTLTIAGTISGVGDGLTKAGAGTLFLDNSSLATNADNTFSGGVTVNAGTLQVNKRTSGKTPLGSGNATVNAGGTLVGGNADAFGFTAGLSPATIFINGGTVTDLPGGVYRLTLRDINFTGGTLTSDPTNTGDGNGNYSLNAGTVETNAASSTALISAGTVALQNGSAAGQTTFTVAAGNVTGGATPGVDLLVSSNLRNWNTLADGINKDGPGVMVLSGSNTYSGPTVVRGGTLRLANSTLNNNIASSLAITVNSGATLDVSGITATGGFQLSSPQTLANAGTVVGAVDATSGTLATGTGTYGDIILDGGTFTPGSASVIGMVGAGNLTVNSGQLTLKFGGPNADRVHLSGGSNLSNTAITINQLSIPTPGSYLVLTAGSPLANITPGVLFAFGRISYSIDGTAFAANPNQILVDVVGGPATLKWTGADSANNPNQWNNTQTDANWQRTDAGTSDPTHFYDGDFVVFDGTNTGPSNVTISGTVTPGSITVSAGTYTFGGTGSIAGNGPLAVANGASLTTPIVGAGPITANGTLIFNNTSDLTLSNTISGTGAVHVAGTANLILGASNDFSGTFVLDSGTLAVGIAGALGNSTPAASVLFPANVPAATTLNLNGISATVSGLNSDPMNPGGATVDNTGAAAATLTLNSAATNTFAGVLQNSGAKLNLTVTGGGTLVLSGVNSFTGTTIITGASTIQTAAAANLVGLTGQVQFNNGTLHITADPNNPGAIVYASTLSNKFTTSGNAGATGTFNVDPGMTFQTQASTATQTSTTASLQTAGSGTAGSSFTKTGGGTMIIYGQNNQQDTSFKLQGGTIDLRSARGLGGQDTNAVRLDMSDGTTLILDNDPGFSNVTVTPPAGLTGTDFLTGLRAATAGGTINVTVDQLTAGVANSQAIGALQAAGAFTMNVTSGLNMTSGSAGLFLDQNPGQTGGGFNGAVTLTGDGTFNIVNNAATGVAMQMTINGPVTGAFGVIKSGTGTLTLNSASTYTGATTVNNGTLRTANAGTISAGPLVINAAAGAASIVSLGNSQSVQSLTVAASPTGSARIDVAAGDALTAAAAGATSLQGNLNKTGDGALEVAGTSSISDNTAIQVNGGTLRFNLAAGPAKVGSATSVSVNNAAVLELAGATSALSHGTAAHSANIANNSTAAAGVHVTGTNQKVGDIDGAGTTQVDSGSDLTANHIIQGALVIGGDATHPALATIDASDATGNPLSASLASLFGEQNSLALSGGLGARGINSVSLSRSSITDLASVSGGILSDGANLSSVPEPSSVLLVLLGILGVVSRKAAVSAIHRRDRLHRET
jgi:fibronectin-binding autotransporter adhesin